MQGGSARPLAAEIGTMRVTEQIDALQTLGTNPIAYLVSPRLLAATAMLPLLVLVGDVIGVGAGYLLATTQLGLSPQVYLAITWDAFSWSDTAIGLVKAGVFGVFDFLNFHLSRLHIWRRGAGGGAGSDLGCRLVFGSHFSGELYHHSLVFCPMIHFDAIHKSFGARQVLQGVDLTIDQGESVVLIGRSGRVNLSP